MNFKLIILILQILIYNTKCYIKKKTKKLKEKLRKLMVKYLYKPKNNSPESSSSYLLDLPINKQINDSVNKCVNNSLKERITDSINEQITDLVDKYVDDSTKKYIKDYIRNCLNKKLSECTDDVDRYIKQYYYRNSKRLKKLAEKKGVSLEEILADEVAEIIYEGTSESRFKRPSKKMFKKPSEDEEDFGELFACLTMVRYVDDREITIKILFFKDRENNKITKINKKK